MADSTDDKQKISAVLADILNEKQSSEHLQVLETFTSALKDAEYRDAVGEDVFSDLLQVLTRLSEGMQSASESGDDDARPSALQLQLAAECFRSQRNSCVQSPRNQNLLRELGFIGISLKLLSFLQTLNLETKDGLYEPLRCGIQFLGNLAVGNQMSKDEVWQLSFPDVLLQLLCIDDEKVVNYTSMVLHTCLDEAKVEDLSKPQNIKLALKVMELCRTQPDLDWTSSVLMATQHFLKSSALVESMYSGMSHHDSRVTLLELLLAQLREEGSEGCGVPPSVAHFLASSFQKGCGAVLTLATGSASSNEEALTVISLLDVLCEMTSDHKQFMFLQDHPDLLETTVELLEQVHAIGKASRNIFSATQNFSTFTGEEDPASDSPVVSFKAHLIRLIGNLCHGNASNQNKVRELDGIPLILDNCNIDSNNPFISQWAIFAIRNLLENNQQNQEQVAALERRGPVDYSALRELGFLVEERDGSLLLKTVRKDS
uniref:Ataxin-10 n=1 Tax=Poecilia formosa TaxID=48698 RepID=A0A087Y0P0_POEFO